jgi:release factor glutamine methyltransferase
MKLKQALAQARESLLQKDIEDAPLESEILLRHTLGISRVQLYLDLENELPPPDEAAFLTLVERRIRGEPSAYITGHREFYGLDFMVDRRVLIPRPESELLVETALKLARERGLTSLADIGTGCGAIAVSLAANLPDAVIYATDISAGALEVARHNCREHGVAARVHLLQGDLLQPLPKPVGLITANLPYVMEGDLPGAGPLSFEPALALNGGPDGLKYIERLCSQLGGKLEPGGCLLMEIGQGQGQAVQARLSQLFPAAEISIIPDFGGIDRMADLRLTQT